MSCMPSHLMQSTMCSSRSYRPLWLTSNSYEYPKYTFLHPNLNKQVALILYYAHVMDQKKLLNDFFKLCKDSFENKYGGKGLESAVKTWIKHSIVKLHRRREQIISNAVTTFQTEMIRALSRILLSIFCDLLRESSDKVSCSLDTLSKKRMSGVTVTSKCASSFFSEREMLLPRTSKSNDFFACISEFDQLLLCLPFQENKNLAVSVSKNNPFDWLHKFWLTFCYQPNPTNSIYNGNTTSFNHTFQNSISRKTTSFNRTSLNYIYSETIDLNQTSGNCIAAKTTDFDQSGTPLKLTESNIKSHNKNVSIFNQAPDSPLTLNTSLELNEDLSSTWSEYDSESSDSWSLTELADEVSEEVCLNTISKTPGINLGHSNPTLLWLSSSSDIIDADLNSDDESVIFEDAITEENCLERGSTSGSLYFIDTDDDDDYDVMFSEASAVVNFPIDTYDYEAKSQGYENPCFEEEFRSIRVPQYIRSVNESWSEMMLDLENKPRQASKVSFAPEPKLVTVHCFEKTDENSFDASAILDRMRFQRRIQEFNHILAPFLTCEHRKEIERRNCFYQD